METKTRPLGTLDIFGADFLQRKFVCDCLERVYQSFGYDPLQTPALEFEEVFTGHHGEGGKIAISPCRFYGEKACSSL